MNQEPDQTSWWLLLDESPILHILHTFQLSENIHSDCLFLFYQSVIAKQQCLQREFLLVNVDNAINLRLFDLWCSTDI